MSHFGLDLGFLPCFSKLWGRLLQLRSTATSRYNTRGLHVMILLALTVFDIRSAQWTSTVTNFILGLPSSDLLDLTI